MLQLDQDFPIGVPTHEKLLGPWRALLRSCPLKVNPEKTNTLCILMQSFESLGTSDENRSLKDILALGPSEKLTRSGNDQLWRLSQFLHFQLQICRQATTPDFSIDLLKNKSHHIDSGSWTSSSQNLEELNTLLMMYQALIGTMHKNYSIITSLKDFLNHHRDRITCWPRLNPEDESSVIYSDSIYRITEITSNLQRQLSAVESEYGQVSNSGSGPLNIYPANGKSADSRSKAQPFQSEPAQNELSLTEPRARLWFNLSALLAWYLGLGKHSACDSHTIYTSSAEYQM